MRQDKRRVLNYFEPFIIWSQYFSRDPRKRSRHNDPSFLPHWRMARLAWSVESLKFKSFTELEEYRLNLWFDSPFYPQSTRPFARAIASTWDNAWSLCTLQWWNAMPGPGEELEALKGWERKRCPKGPIARRLPLYSLLSGRRILSPIYIWPHLGFGDGGGFLEP